ncbi:MAG TPA: DUF4157 domain-containing protein [Steroidobacteraceae bacterium]|nr:DUF4157 domain-containing protein [Steroidobacteraceae bacterium]
MRTRDCMPEGLRAALRELFDDRVDDVEVVENSWYARLHRGARATTRRNRILLPGPASEFFDDPALVLHEYFHVLRQWNRGRLSVARYLAEWVRHGYWSNRYERQARRFVALRLPALRKHLARNFHTMRDPETPDAAR